MDIVLILKAVGIMSVLGLGFGALLGVTDKVFKVETDPKVDALRECLPGANCGACGYPGCDGYAAAVAAGKSEVGLCAVGGPKVSAKMAEIMGVEAAADTGRKVAVVACQGFADRCKTKGEYEGIHDCVAALMVNSGIKKCSYACFGLGTCERACPFDAIHIDPIKQIAVVDEEKCQSCGRCVAACPQHVLSMRPAERMVTVRCRNPVFGIKAKEQCENVCISCGACAKACQFGAITMVDHIPVIDHSKCIGCMACSDVCPTGAMNPKSEKRKIAYIDAEKCSGCNECTSYCKFGAIKGSEGEKHLVLKACTGCGLCVEHCKEQAIGLRTRWTSRDPKDKA